MIIDYAALTILSINWVSCRRAGVNAETGGSFGTQNSYQHGILGQSNFTKSNSADEKHQRRRYDLVREQRFKGRAEWKLDATGKRTMKMQV